MMVMPEVVVVTVMTEVLLVMTDESDGDGSSVYRGYSGDDRVG